MDLPLWEELARDIVTGFGVAPAGFGEVSALLCLPFGERHWAVTQVESRSEGTVGFRILILSKTDWLQGIDPFALNRDYPPNWDNCGQADSIEYELNFAPATVEQAASWLAGQDHATLLGGLQAILDGARLWHESSSPLSAYAQTLWNLLPYRSRFDFSFATFAFQPIPELKYQALPKGAIPAPLPMGVLSLQQTGDYPLGRYEQALQLAIEETNTDEFEVLLRRRTSHDTLKLAVGLIAAMIVGLVVMRLLR